MSFKGDAHLLVYDSECMLWYAPQVNRWVRREWTGTYRWSGMRIPATLRDDWVEHKLLEYQPA